MTNQACQHVDLRVRSQRRRLRPRYAPYYECLSVGRSIGYAIRNQKKRCYWMARYRSKKGTYHERRLGLADTYTASDRHDRLSYKEAEAAAQAWFASAAVRRAAIPTRPLGQVTTVAFRQEQPSDDVYRVGDALVEYFDWKRLATTPATFHTLLTSVNLSLIPRIGDVPAEEVTGEHFRAFVKDMLRTPPRRGNQKIRKKMIPIENLTPDELRKRRKVINRHVSVMRRALDMAWESGRIESERPAKCWHHLPNIDQPRILHLSRAECRALLSYCSEELQQVVKAALYTGCRFSELMQLRVDHYGRDGPGILVPPVKSTKHRFVFLPDEGLAFFSQLTKGRKRSEPMFVRADGRDWRYNLRRPYKEAIRNAGLPDEFTFHGLRHTYASQLVSAGTPLIVVAEQLGHRTVNTVANTYGHLAPQIRESEVQQRFEALDLEQTGPVPRKLRRRCYAKLNG